MFCGWGGGKGVGSQKSREERHLEPARIKLTDMHRAFEAPPFGAPLRSQAEHSRLAFRLHDTPQFRHASVSNSIMICG